MIDDVRVLLRCFENRAVRFLVVGAHALAAHGIPRMTGDLDVWVETNSETAERVWLALVGSYAWATTAAWERRSRALANWLEESPHESLGFHALLEAEVRRRRRRTNAAARDQRKPCESQDFV